MAVNARMNFIFKTTTKRKISRNIINQININKVTHKWLSFASNNKLTVTTTNIRKLLFYMKEENIFLMDQ